MKKVFVLVASSALFLVASGCGNKCDDLADVCANCEGATATACNAVVDAGDAELCEAGIPGYETLCGAAGDDDDAADDDDATDTAE